MKFSQDTIDAAKDLRSMFVEFMDLLILDMEDPGEEEYEDDTEEYEDDT